MTLTFSHFCELLELLETQYHQQRSTYAKHVNPSENIVQSWFDRHHARIARCGYAAIALLSALFPERRPDRTYNLQHKRLVQLVGRALGLGRSRLKILSEWTQNGSVDLAACVATLIADSGLDDNAHDEVTLDEIDAALNNIAGNSISSAPALRQRANGDTANDILPGIIRRLRSFEAKWLIRMIFKSYSPVEIPEMATLRTFHFLLPYVLAVQNSLDAAVDFLSRPEIRYLPARPAREYEKALVRVLSKSLTPRIGVMIQRMELHKSRNIKHCLNLCRSRTMSVERKYDGEFCQVHIDLSLDEPDYIKIFSKSGRDSTNDRIALQGPIRRALNLGRSGCKIRKCAILEGELVPYSSTLDAILPFHHVRKHVLHGGRRIGTHADSPKKTGETLVIVFFDILLLDEKNLLNEPQEMRRAYLKAVVSIVQGISAVSERRLINSGAPDAPDTLREIFANAITQRWEGLILKGVEDPYVSWSSKISGIKLKKDYIYGLGDMIDICIIGGSRDVHHTSIARLLQLQWTHFYLACLLNKSEVCRYDMKPVLLIIDRIGPGSLSHSDLLQLNREATSLRRLEGGENDNYCLQNSRRDFSAPTGVFFRPIIVELMGAGYERPQSVDYFVLRFPRKSGSCIKIHHDRGFSDILSFHELQQLAEASFSRPDATEVEDAKWIKKLKGVNHSVEEINQSQDVILSKTPASMSTITLSPRSVRRSSTRQSNIFIRADTCELEEHEYEARYPNLTRSISRRPPQPILKTGARSKLSIGHKRLVSQQNDLLMSLRQVKRRRSTVTSNSALVAVRSKMVLNDTSISYCHNAYVSAATNPEMIVTSSCNKQTVDTAMKVRKSCEEQQTPSLYCHRLLPAISHSQIYGGMASEPSPENQQEASLLSLSVTRSTVNDSLATSTAVRQRVDSHQDISQLAPALVIPAAARTGVGRIFETLSNAGTEAIFSTEQFVKNFFASLANPDINTTHIILTDVSNLKAAVTDLREICRLFIQQSQEKKSAALHAQPTMLVFDLRILRDCGAINSCGREANGAQTLRRSSWFCTEIEVVDRPESGGITLKMNWDGTYSHIV